MIVTLTQKYFAQKLSERKDNPQNDIISDIANASVEGEKPLDIKEQLIRDALAPDASELANIALARLILQRQKDRIFTKLKYRQKPLDKEDEDYSF